MPYVRCDECNMASYATAAWSHSAECSHCGSPLEIARHGSCEANAGDAAQLPPSAVRDVGPGTAIADPVDSSWR